MAEHEAFIIRAEVVRITHAVSIYIQPFGEHVEIYGGAAGGETYRLLLPIDRIRRLERRRLLWELRWWKASGEQYPLDSLRGVAGALLHSRVRYAMRLYQGTQLLLWATPPHSEMRQLIVLNECLADGHLADLGEVIEREGLDGDGFF